MQGVIHISSCVWRKNQGSTAYTLNGKSVGGRGVAPDGSYTIREVDDELNNACTMYRDYSQGGSFAWAVAPGQAFHGVSEDGTILLGTQKTGFSPTPVPCFWTSGGNETIGYLYLGQDPCVPSLSSKSGQIIAGIVYTTKSIPNYGSVTKTFRWNTATNQVDYYLPPEFLETEPYFVSPDGNLLEFGGWLDPYHAKTVLMDTSNQIE